MLATSFLMTATPDASAETRTLKLYYTHTREKAEITFKKNGRYIQSGLKELNQFLRDWRRNEPTKMDPRLFDIVWEAYQAAGGRDYIHVVSAYRSPATNSMLRKRSKGVAEKSQHMLGKAMDFYVPGVKLSKLRAAALRVQGGGVGYYPKSGSPFVHLDVGNVRHWPRMNRSELMALFPDGKTIHVPTDGKPLPGYKQALASYNSRKKSGGSGSTIQMASAPSGGGFLSGLFGGGADDEEDTSDVALAPVPWNENASRRVKPKGKVEAPSVAEEPAPAAAPQPEPELPTAETIVAALPARAVPKPLFAPRPEAEIGAGAEMAATFDADPPVASPAAEEVEVALGIPLPTRRPDYAPAPVVLASNAQDTAADTKTGSLAIAGILAAEQRGPLVAQAPVPDTRPDWRQQVTAYASLPDEKPAMAAAPQQVALAAKDAMLSVKGQRAMASAATPRLAMLTRGEGTDPKLALGTGVRTTGKSARPTAQDSTPESRPVVIPVQQELAKWALRTGFVTTLRTAEEPARAYEAIITAPSAVYTSGFTKESEVAEANRFTGKAVTFLSVAKFAAN
jgi:uncharacterized protein YcbK (DUF882 family)